MKTTPETPDKQFKKLLLELFQFPSADLNFGIYRVMNQKRSSVERFINKDIIGMVDEALNEKHPEVGDPDRDAAIDFVKSSLQTSLGKDVFDAKGRIKPAHKNTPAGKAWQILNGDVNHSAATGEGLRNEVFNRLYDFFSRYYDDGDFICQKRYGSRESYAVPYNGEEVLMHWANKDQYYIKTAEHFPRYEYKLSGGASVRFEMREASVERDNNKSKDKKFFFPLADELKKLPGGKGYVLPFEFRALAKGEEGKYGDKKAKDADEGKKAGFGTDKMQAKIIEKVILKLRKNAAARPLLVPASVDESESVTHLKIHIDRYVKRNTADFFIHKDLEGFLLGELDYYLNKVVLKPEELEDDNANTKNRLRVAKAVRTVAEQVIKFLAQIEGFQKAIWEKKKFITRTDYLITLRTITDKNLLEEIVDRDAQWRDWQALNFFDARHAKKLLAKGGAKARRDFLQAHPTLTVDTAKFTDSFKERWLSTVENLDDAIGGVLFHGENWQVLNVMQEKYRGRIKSIYVDPPYNTDSSEIIYKNGYKHSSWNSLIYDRLRIGKNLMSKDGFSAVTIDYAELFSIGKIYDSVFEEDNRVGIVTIYINPKGRQHERFFSSSTEYMLVYANQHDASEFNKTTTDKEKAKQFDLTDDNGNYRLDPFARIRGNTRREDKPDFYYPIYVHPKLKEITLEKIKGYHEVFPRDNNGNDYTWKNVKKSFAEKLKSDLYAAKIEDGRVVIFNKFYEQQVHQNIWIDKKYFPEFQGTNLLKNILGGGAFSYPKSVYAVSDYVKLTAGERDAILDYFAGSGTTAHAVINLNREDGGKRKFILAEMGEYFGTVILPRIRKVIFTPEWKNGAPKSDYELSDSDIDNAPGVIKYHRIESYDDALDNIHFEEAGDAVKAQIRDYVPRYMLPTESRDSATFAKSTDAFKNPFSYKLRKVGDQSKAHPADMPETFAYLIGLREKTRRTLVNGKTRYVIQAGVAEGRQTLVIWRNTEGWKKSDYVKERDFLAKMEVTKGMDRIYVNDDSLVKGAESLTSVFAVKMFGGD